jgi:hypothetical protein
VTNAEVSLWIGSGALGKLQPFSLREARLPPIDVDSGSYLMLSLEASHEYRNVAWTPLRLSGYTGRKDSWNLFAVEPLDWFIDHAKQSTHTGLAGW